MDANTHRKAIPVHTRTKKGQNKLCCTTTMGTSSGGGSICPGVTGARASLSLQELTQRLSEWSITSRLPSFPDPSLRARVKSRTRTKSPVGRVSAHLSKRDLKVVPSRPESDCKQRGERGHNQQVPPFTYMKAQRESGQPFKSAGSKPRRGRAFFHLNEPIDQKKLMLAFELPRIPSGRQGESPIQ